MKILYCSVFVDKKLMYEYPKSLQYQVIIKNLKIGESAIVSSGKEYIFVKKVGVLTYYCISTNQDSNVWNFLEKIDELYQKGFDLNLFIRYFEDFNSEISSTQDPSLQFYETQAKTSKKYFYLKIGFFGALVMIVLLVVFLIVLFLACGITLEKCK